VNDNPPVLILAGGFGSRISDDSTLVPKPMLEIGGMPILWHIMKNCYAQGLDDFVILAGYKSHVIKEFFANYRLRDSDVVLDSRGADDKVIIQNGRSERWRVTVLETGLATMTGGRVKRAHSAIGDGTFFLTYGDGVADVNYADLLAFHRGHGRTATLTAVQPQGRFGILDLMGDAVPSFREKSQADVGWINGGFMVLEPPVFSLLEDDDTVLEREPMEQLAEHGELMAYRHTGYWQCMDTPRDRTMLQALWDSGTPPWRNW